ncbi:MAG: hypothetical protein JRF25_13410 [Deltaproteobacteria bacterium]|nr:hypothetical protein [Deltaproteobacteria bacterium]
MTKPFYLKRNLNNYYLKKKENRSLFLRMVTLGVCFIVTAFMLDTYPAHGQMEIKTIEAVGTAIVHKKDVGTAKQQAIANGLVSALDKVLEEILPIELIAQNFRIINKIIYSETEKYINDYKVLTEAASDKNYRVLIQAKVSVKRLKSRLAKSGVMHVRKRKLQNIEIVVQGTRNLSHFFNFRKGLKEINGVKNIQVSDMQGDEANILVNFEGSSKEFTDALVLKKFEKFSIRIFEISETKLRIELVPG